jgi:YegS/Rv2252/BmrU family lipid kinase
MNPLLIVNPSSAGGATGKVFDAMRGPIERALGACDVVMTDRPRHAVDLAREAAESGRRAVVAVGGDGTIHEVVGGLMLARDRGAASTRLGIIGQGTGGDFRKTLGLEHRLDRYLAPIAEGKTKRVDVGRFRAGGEGEAAIESFFVNILSVGLGGVVDRYVASSSRAFGGTVAYFTASLRGLADSEVGRLFARIHLGGEVREEEIETRSLAICNGRFFGGGMEVAPMASPEDGVFEVIDLGAASRLRFATLSAQIYSGKHLDRPDVRHFRCDRLELELRSPRNPERFPLDVDGEPVGLMPLTIDVVPGAIEVFAP